MFFYLTRYFGKIITGWKSTGIEKIFCFSSVMLWAMPYKHDLKDKMKHGKGAQPWRRRARHNTLT